MGLDCWGLVRAASLELFGRELPPYLYTVGHYLVESSQYVRLAHDGLLPGWTQHAVPRRGDVLTFNIKGESLHCGLYLGCGEFLHTLSAGQGSTIESINDATWSRRLDGIFRRDSAA